MTQPPATSVAIVEDDPTLGSSLKRIVDSMPGCRCAGVWRTAEEALVKVPAFGPEVVLMDINLPGMSGIEATARVLVAETGEDYSDSALILGDYLRSGLIEAIVTMAASAGDLMDQVNDQAKAASQAAR